MLTQTFSLNNDEIVRSECFSHTNEPMFTFNPARNLVYVNAVSLKRLPDMEYALIVISSSEKRLSIYPCSTNEQHAVRLRSGGKNRNKPRQVRCYDDFSEKMLLLMKWKRDCRYRMIGYTATGINDTIIAFDLSSAEEFSPYEHTADISVDADGGFGIAFAEQRSNPIIKIIEQDIEIYAAKSEDE